MAFAGLLQRMAPSSYPLLLATNAILFVTACFGFLRLLTHAFPGSAQRLDRSLLTACFVVQPSFLGAIVQPGLDLPLLPCFIWCVVFALEGRWVLLVIAGIAIVFTKETGVLLYAAVLGCYAVVFVLRAPGSGRSRLVALFRLSPLAAPGILFAGYLLYRATLPNQPVIWYTGTVNESLLHQFLVPRIDLHLIAYLVIIMVLNFAWVAGGLIGCDLFVGAVRRAHRLPRRPVAGADPRVLGFLVLLTLVTTVALTRFTTFGHSRYFLTIIAMLLVPFYASMLRLGLSPPVRRVMVGVFAGALLVSNLRTVDPLSRWVYGTFPVGKHEMLEMTSITGECCARGLDQLVYSLEFTVLQDLEQAALAAIAPGDSTVLVTPDSASWHYVGLLDATTHRRTLRRDRVVRPAIVEVQKIKQGSARPPLAWFVAFPNGRVERALRDLAHVYVIGQERRFWQGGYSLSVYPLTLRETVR
jgi:hypothetical protein